MRNRCRVPVRLQFPRLLLSSPGTGLDFRLGGLRGDNFVAFRGAKGDNPGRPYADRKATIRTSETTSLGCSLFPGPRSRRGTATHGPAHKDVPMTLHVLHPPTSSPDSETDDRLGYARQIIRSEAAALDLV